MSSQLNAVKPQGGSGGPFGGFASPTSNTTYTPNQFFDVCLPNCSRGALRLVAFMIRKTLGWSDEHGNPQAEQHRISFTDFEQKAGISRDMIRAAVDEAIEGRFVRRVKLGRPNSVGRGAITAVYELRWDDGVEYIKDPKRFRGFFGGEGNRTYIPNQFFDLVIPYETLAVVKVVGSVIRFSIGFQTKWGHRRQLISLSYQDIQNYSHLRDRKTLAAAIRIAIAGSYLQRVEEGFFDPDAGRLSRAATYAVKWLSQAAESSDGQKTPPEIAITNLQSENPTGNGQKTPPDERSENPTDIQITDSNNTFKQQDDFVAFERLRKEGFDTKAAHAVASRFDAGRIERQIGWIRSRNAKTNRLGLLRKAIEQDWPAPGKEGTRPERPVAPRASSISFGDAIEQAKSRLLGQKSASPNSSQSPA